MAERRENSVLFSLSELRRIEEDRIKQEEAEVQARAEADRQAREAEEKRRRDEEERKRREGEEFAMRERLEREKMQREEGVRLQESERRAQIEANTKLQQERMVLEIQAQTQLASRKPPLKAIVGIVGALMVVVVALGWYMYSTHQAEKRAQEIKIAAQKAELERMEAQRMADLSAMNKIGDEMKALQKELDSAQSDADRARVRARMADAQNRYEKKKKDVAANSSGPKLKIDDSGTDPLGGLGR